MFKLTGIWCNKLKKILFITGTRADYGKLKPLMRAVDDSLDFEAYVYVSGMHLSKKHGCTYREVLHDRYSNVHVAYGLRQSGSMCYDLGNLICDLTGYVEKIEPDLIVVHGDRIDTLAGASVGALSNVRVAHVEGGELSGTIDESIRHAVSKLSHIHFTCNEEAAHRLLQLGEESERIYVIGSPDIDIMFSSKLPSLDDALDRYDIPFKKYGILLYHPVTTEYDQIPHNIANVVEGVLRSEKNFIVIYPNNDSGNEFIISEYRRLERNTKRFRIFPSIRFEYFLTLMKNAQIIVGNSSAGIREASVYGIPALDIGSRQKGRYSQSKDSNIRHVDENALEIAEVISRAENICHVPESKFGEGDSTVRFMMALRGDVWNFPLQKKFVDLR